MDSGTLTDARTNRQTSGWTDGRKGATSLSPMEMRVYLPKLQVINSLQNDKILY